ncbi:DUF4230 domain-containing protein [Petrimonas sp.]|uniref:DUF4230 domain-containing protein n=1 Tax=Petrimonas sp. TaxID=2023866 RepID=UPI003F518B69
MKENIPVKKTNRSTYFFLATTIVLAMLLIFNKMNNARDKKYDTSTVLSKIVHIQELATVKYNYAGVIGYKDNFRILNIAVPLTDKYFLLKYNGYLKAGVDFSRIKVNIHGENVHVSMPRAQIFDIVIDENSIKVYNESENAFNPIKIQDYNKALMDEKETMRQDAIKQGLLSDASRQAELAIKSLLEEMGFKKVDVTTEIIIPELQ